MRSAAVIFSVARDFCAETNFRIEVRNGDTVHLITGDGVGRKFWGHRVINGAISEELLRSLESCQMLVLDGVEGRLTVDKKEFMLIAALALSNPQPRDLHEFRFDIYSG